VVIGAQDDDDGGSNRGAVWILFLGSPTYITNLITIYNSRPDLPSAFPETSDGDFERLLMWAGLFGAPIFPNLLGTHDAIYDLMVVCYIRPDLQANFPEAMNGIDLSGMYCWADSYIDTNGANSIHFFFLMHLFMIQNVDISD